MESFFQMQDQSDDRTLLRDMLERLSLQVGRTFKLSSGAESNVYIDAKLTTCTPAAMPLVGRVFLAKLNECGWSPSAAGGLTVGADPIAFAIARESLDHGRAVSAFIVRKLPKAHGMERFIEGLGDTQGLKVVIVDDVCTEGKSTGDAIDKARKAGMLVLGAVCLVDREQGAAEFLMKNYECKLESIFKLAEILAHHDQLSATQIPVGAHS
jgi:orotate phosphoribosyltransferase